MLLLARKGDADYWSGDNWRKNRKDRRLWSADIARRMLEEGLVKTVDGYSRSGAGIATVMTEATSASKTRHWGPHLLTGVVAQIRGMRLLQSMAPEVGWDTKLGGVGLRSRSNTLLWEGFCDVSRAYDRLQRPPWDDEMEWGPQEEAGHATTDDGGSVYVLSAKTVTCYGKR